MTETAVLKKAAIGRFCPVTNLYECSDGRHLLVTVKEPWDMGDSVESVTGVRIPISRTHAPTGTEVFLADERGRLIDADGDPANGMTPLKRFDAGTTFEAALSELGYGIAMEEV